MKTKGKIIWHLACDESGIHGSASHYGFGSLWMRWQRRGDFSRQVREIQEQHRYSSEIKWTKVKPRYKEFFFELVDYFFKTQWLAFHCLVVDKAVVKRELHGNSWDLARRKHFTKMISTKLRDCVKAHASRDCKFRIVVDPIPSSYAKAHECVEIIGNNQLKQALDGTSARIESLIEVDSKTNLQIQLSDLLLGGVMAAWNEDATSETKLELQRHIAGYLGWGDLKSDTRPKERKFNT